MPEFECEGYSLLLSFPFFFLFVRIDRIKQREKENVRDSMTFTVLSSCFHRMSSGGFLWSNSH